MCMKYLNAIIVPYKSAFSTSDGAITALNAPLCAVNCQEVKDGKAILEDFVVMTDLNFLGTAHEDHKKDNPLEQGKKIGIIIRLTKCAQNVEDRKYIDLDKFVIDLAEVKAKGWTHKACFDYYNHARLTRIPDDIRWIPVGQDGQPAVGNYVLKVIVEDFKTGIQTVQSMCPLQILPVGELPRESALGLGFHEVDQTC